jgi:hypothetical protein
VTDAEKFQCPAFVAPGQRCVRNEGHAGRHDGPILTGLDYKCPACKKRFASLGEFDAHAPCEG